MTFLALRRRAGVVTIGCNTIKETRRVTPFPLVGEVKQKTSPSGIGRAMLSLRAGGLGVTAAPQGRAQRRPVEQPHQTHQRVAPHRRETRPRRRQRLHPAGKCRRRRRRRRRHRFIQS